METMPNRNLRRGHAQSARLYTHPRLNSLAEWAGKDYHDVPGTVTAVVAAGVASGLG
jgi:hypothetical protein